MHLQLPSMVKIPFLSHPTLLHCSGLPFPHAQESSGRIQQVTLRRALCPGIVYSAGRGGALGPSLVQFLQQMEHNSLLKSGPSSRHLQHFAFGIHFSPQDVTVAANSVLCSPRQLFHQDFTSAQAARSGLVCH